jgi:hypothetical protein
MRRLLSTCAASAAVVALVSPSSTAAAAGRCKPVTAETETFATGPASFAGMARGTLGGEPFSGSVTTTVTSAPEPAGASGVLFATTSHEIALPAGTITTSDVARLVPTQETGVYRLITHATVVEGGTGQLALNGIVNFVDGSAEAQVKGVICPV